MPHARACSDIRQAHDEASENFSRSPRMCIIWLVSVGALENGALHHLISISLLIY